MQGNNQPQTLYVIVCASPVAQRALDFVPRAQAKGWDVCVILTPQAGNFVDAAFFEQMTGHPVRSQFKHPSEPDILPRPHAIVALPVTFNTLNKWALGITDTLAVALLCEYTGLKIPIVAFPATGEGLGATRAFHRSVRMLTKEGVRLLHQEQIRALEREQCDEMILQMLTS